jgi:hypothetical protein
MTITGAKGSNSRADFFVNFKGGFRAPSPASPRQRFNPFVAVADYGVRYAFQQLVGLEEAERDDGR